MCCCIFILASGGSRPSAKEGARLTINVEFCEDNSGTSKKMQYFPWIRHCSHPVGQLYGPIICHPLGGRTPGKYNVVWGLFRGITLMAGKRRQVCFPKALYHRENRGLCKRNRSILSCLKHRWPKLTLRGVLICLIMKRDSHLMPYGGVVLQWFIFLAVSPIPLWIYN